MRGDAITLRGDFLAQEALHRRQDAMPMRLLVIGRRRPWLRGVVEYRSYRPAKLFRRQGAQWLFLPRLRRRGPTISRPVRRQASCHRHGVCDTARLVIGVMS